VISRLKIHGINDIVLAGGYGMEMLKAVLGDGSRLGVALEYSPESKPLGTAGAIKQAESYFQGTGSFFVLNGDIVADLDYRQLLAYHQRHNAAATIALHRVIDPSRYGVVELAAEGRIHSFIEKPAPGTVAGNLINAGCYVLEEGIFDLIPPGEETSIEREVFPKLCAERIVYGWEHKGLWIDIGTPESYLEANRAILTTTMKKQREPTVPQSLLARGAHLTPPVVMAEESRVDPSSNLGPNVTLGRRVTIEARARIRDAVVFDDAVISSAVVVERSVVGQGAVIGRGIHLKGLTLVGDEAVVDAGSQIPVGARICPNCHIRPGTAPASLLC
jgi:mannose-1-phosphate guanylyltransferase